MRAASLVSLLTLLCHTARAQAQSEPDALPPAAPEPEPVASPPAEPAAPVTPAPLEVLAPTAVAPGADRPSAEGAPTDAPPTRKPMMSAGAGIEGYWFSSKRLGSTFPMIPFGRFALSKWVLLDVHLPFSVSTNATLSESNPKAGTSIGNPTLGLTYVATGPRTTWFIGGHVGAPVAGSGKSETSQTSNALAQISSALYDLHYWAPNSLPIGMRVGVEHEPSRGLLMRGSIDPTVYVPAGEDSSQRKALLYYQMRVELEGRSAAGWGGGLGLQLVHLLSGAGGDAWERDKAQAAIEPFVSYDSATTFARLGFLLAMDPPLGPGLDPDKVASLRLNLGSHF